MQYFSVKMNAKKYGGQNITIAIAHGIHKINENEI
jgi:hypothetical protein